MAARSPLFSRRWWLFIILGVALLALIAGSSFLIFRQPSIAFRPANIPTAMQTATAASAPTSILSPTPTPQPPLVLLMAHGNPDLREIALTFDDGPSAGYTQAILAVLRQYHIHATFFMVGGWVQRYPDLAKAVVADGNAVGDHTWNHADLTQLSASQAAQQLSNTRDIIQQVTGAVPIAWRPPYGAYNRQVLNIAHSLHFSTVLWSIDPHDYSLPGIGPIISTVRVNARNGSIILMHDGGGNRSQTVAALPTIIEQSQARGFTFVTIPQMLLHLAPTSGARLAAQITPAPPGALLQFQPTLDIPSQRLARRRFQPPA